MVAKVWKVDGRSMPCVAWWSESGALACLGSPVWFFWSFVGEVNGVSSVGSVGPLAAGIGIEPSLLCGFATRVLEIFL